jgi:hypothetical protein
MAAVSAIAGPARGEGAEDGHARSGRERGGKGPDGLPRPRHPRVGQAELVAGVCREGVAARQLVRHLAGQTRARAAPS